MGAWEIAKLLLEHCESEVDVERLLLTLDDPSELRELRTMLSAFATYMEVETSSAIAPAAPVVVPEAQQRPKAGRVRVLPDASRATMSDQLESLFRSYGLTNSQVERWFSTNFEINVPIKKGSLQQYLMKVLKDVDLALGNRILAAAQAQMMRDSSQTSEIKDYWDELDKRFSKVE